MSRLRITWVTEQGANDLEVSGLTDEACLSELVAAVSPGAVELQVDGTPAGGTDLVADRLQNGSVVSVNGALGPHREAGVAIVSALHALSGPHAGQVWKLSPGLYTVADTPEATIRLSGITQSVLEVTHSGKAAWNGKPFPAASLKAGPHRLRVTPAPPPTATPPRGPSRFFQRPPRHLSSPPGRAPTVPTRETSAGQSRRLGVVALALPILAGVAMAIVFGRIHFLAFALLSPAMMAGQAWEDRRRRKRESRQAAQNFAMALRKYAHLLRQQAGQVAGHDHQAHPSVSELLLQVASHSPRIWERRPAHPDFLQVVLGYGSRRWVPPADTQVEPEVKDLQDQLGVLHGVPVVVGLQPGRVLGIAGPPDQRGALAAALLCQLAVAHGPADLRIGVISDRPAEWDWVKWLPHTAADLQGQVRLLASTPREAEALLTSLACPSPPLGPAHIILVDHAQLGEEHRRALREVLTGVGLTRAGQPTAAIFLTESPQDLPALCTEVVELGATAQLKHPAQGVVQSGWDTAGLACGVAITVARRLACWEDPEQTHPGGHLPQQVRLPQLLGLDDITPAEIARRWDAQGPAPPLSFPIGVSEAGPLLIDLQADGPHGLVAGTTGSGKSELLRTLVAAAAGSVSPRFLSFVLIDYKGGAAFDACRDLPHVVGLVTDLDEHLGSRALQSLEAELAHREQCLRQAGVVDIDQFWGTEPTEPLPRLLVVIDEFALLARELPDFMDALVDIAQRGRSLGVHLLAATQRPAGIVKESIRANTNLRVCLRVQTPADSNDVLGTAQAAGLSPAFPGRGYIRRGPDEPIPFQTCFSALAQESPRPVVQVSPFRFAMAGSDFHSDRPAGEGPTDLQRLVDATQRTWENRGAPAPRRPWCPPLDPDLSFAHLVEGRPASNPIIGLADQPDRQRQIPWSWEPQAEGNLLAFGQASGGPQAALWAVACSLAATFPPAQMHLYGLDNGSDSLAPLATLPHVGSVIELGDLERQERLLHHLRTLIKTRRNQPEDRRLVLLVSDLGALRGAWEDPGIWEMFRDICTSGPPHGVFVAATTDQARGVPPSLLSAFPARLVFALADPLDYALLGVRAPGPGLPLRQAVDPRTQQRVQIAQVSRQDVQEVARIATGTANAPPILALPRTVPIQQVVGAGSVATQEWSLPLGLDSTTLEVAVLPFYPGDHLLIAGPNRSGRTCALAALACIIRSLSPPARLIALCPRPGALADHPDLDACYRQAEQLAEAEKDFPSGETPTVFLIDDAEETADDGLPAQIIAQRPEGVWIFAAGHIDMLRSAHRHWTRSLRTRRRGVILTPEDRNDGDLFGVRQLPAFRAGLSPGRGYLINGGTVRSIQLAHQVGVPSAEPTQPLPVPNMD